MNELRSELAELAEQARPADLLERVYMTSRRLRRRRTAARAVAVVLVLSCAALLFLPDTRGAKELADAPPSFVPRVASAGGVTTMELSLADGAQVDLAFPDGLAFPTGEITLSYPTVYGGCCVLKSRAPDGIRKAGFLADAFGQRRDVWMRDETDGQRTAYRSWMQFAGWWVELPDATEDPTRGFAAPGGTDFAFLSPMISKIKFALSVRGSYPRLTAADDLRFTSAGDLFLEPPSGPSMAFAGPERRLTIGEVGDCRGMRHSELAIDGNRAAQVCQDGVVVRAHGTDDDWAADFAYQVKIVTRAAPG